MTQTIEQKLERHRKTKHDISALSTYLKEIVYGGIDGIVTTFAVVAGFTGAQSGGTAQYSIVTVLLFGLANLFADASSMGLGNFLSTKSEKDFYKGQKNMEEDEIRNDTERESRNTEAILEAKGFSPDDAAKMTTLYKKNPEYWTEFMMQYELELSNPEGDNAYLTAFATFCSFILFGFIPLLPYLFITQPIPAFQNSIGFTLMALTLLGILRWKVTNLNIWRAIFETILLGSLSASVAFIVGMFFKE